MKRLTKKIEEKIDMQKRCNIALLLLTISCPFLGSFVAIKFFDTHQYPVVSTGIIVGIFAALLLLLIHRQTKLDEKEGRFLDLKYPKLQ